eukprot:2755570-Prymnesium_polylepis.1
MPVVRRRRPIARVEGRLGLAADEPAGRARGGAALGALVLRALEAAPELLAGLRPMCAPLRGRHALDAARVVR